MTRILQLLGSSWGVSFCRWLTQFNTDPTFGQAIKLAVLGHARRDILKQGPVKGGV